MKSLHSRDHPRLRGEHGKWYTRLSRVMGSPPPTRGTQSETTCSKIEQGITPAYAGNTYTLLLCCPSTRDHPRLRGEHALFNRWERFNQGSPPPTRGTLPFSHSILSQLQDHPRLRGEHKMKSVQNPPEEGSPPPTRGTPLSVSFIKSSTGITPAYAGNTSKEISVNTME